MAWSAIVGVTLLIAYHLNSAEATQTFNVATDLCPYSPLQGSFNQIYSNRPFVKLVNGSDSAAKIHQVWDAEKLQQFQDCVFHVDSNLYFDSADPQNSQQFSRGLTLSVRKINFRFDPQTQQCIDYVRFTFPASKTDKICGTFDGLSEIGQQTYINVPDGVIKVHIFVDKTKPFAVSESSVELELIFTAYQRCKGENAVIQCHSSDDDFCISDTLKNDGIHNCPPPSSADEPNSPFPLYGTPEQQREQKRQQKKEQNWQRKKIVKKTTGDATQLRSANIGLFYIITFATLMIPTMF